MEFVNFSQVVSPIKAEEASSLVRNFLFALFEKTTQAVKDFGGDKGTRIRKFRDSMSRVRHIESAGSYRVEFYENDIGKARKVCHRFLSSYFSPIVFTSPCSTRDHEVQPCKIQVHLMVSITYGGIDSIE